MTSAEAAHVASATLPASTTATTTIVSLCARGKQAAASTALAKIIITRPPGDIFHQRADFPASSKAFASNVAASRQVGHERRDEERDGKADLPSRSIPNSINSSGPVHIGLRRCWACSPRQHRDFSHLAAWLLSLTVPRKLNSFLTDQRLRPASLLPVGFFNLAVWHAYRTEQYMIELVRVVARQRWHEGCPSFEAVRFQRRRR